MNMGQSISRILIYCLRRKIKIETKNGKNR